MGETMEYTEEQLKQLRSIDLELYRKLTEICRKHELRFVTGFGTTLGAPANRKLCDELCKALPPGHGFSGRGG